MDVSYTNQLHNELVLDLRAVDGEIVDLISKHRKMAMVAQSYVSTLKDHITKHSFRTKEEEIEFFKVIKPKFSALVYYHEKIFNVETQMPHGTAEQKSIFLAREITKIDRFYINNTAFSSYMKKGCTSRDHKYFIAGNDKDTLGLGFIYLDFDPIFSSVHSSLVARFLGAQKALEYLNNRSKTIEDFGETYFGSNTLAFTGTASDLVELAYALSKTNKITNDIKEIIEVFSLIFNIEINDFYRTYHGFKYRKVDRTKFLSLLKDGLNDALDSET